MTPIRLRRGMISVSGTKAREFLQGLVSCDMRKAQPQKDLLVGLLLNAQGRILFDFLLYQQTLYQQALYQQAAPQQHESKTEDHFVIDCAEEDVFPLGRHLRRFVLGSGLRLGIVADKSVFALSVKDSSGASGKDTSGKDALENGDSIPHALRASLGASLEASLKNVPHSLFRDPRHKDMGWRLYMSEKALSEKKLLEISENEQAYTLQRLKCGIPEGRDEIPSHSALPAVYGFDRMHALSYEKGCYVGQEVVARMHYRGAPKRALAAASCPDLSFSLKGEEIRAGTHRAGEVRAHCRDRLLAELQLPILEKYAPEGRVLCREFPVQLESLFAEKQHTEHAWQTPCA